MFITNDIVNISYRKRADQNAARRNPGQEVASRVTVTTNRFGGEAPLLAQPGFVGTEFCGTGMDRVIGFDPAKVMQKV
jgi:hypothetical protein